MRSYWPLLISIILTLGAFMVLPSGSCAVEASLEDDDYYISVDPSDPYQGYLEIQGEIDPGDLGTLETVTVALSVVIHELRSGEATGRNWQAEVTYDDSAVGTSSKVFKRGDGPESFTVLLDPAIYDPNTADGTIPVPPGLSEDTEGRVIVTAEFNGVGVPSGDTTVQATIYPELYHLVNLSTPENDVSMEAGDRLIYSISLKNAGNMVETVYLEVPTLQELDDLDFETSLTEEKFTSVEPGQTVNSTLTIKAPLEIKRTDTIDLVIKSRTEALDPNTLEPASSQEIRIKVELIKSQIEKPDPTDDDDTTDDDDDFEPNPSPGTDPIATGGETNTWVVVIIVGFILVAILIIAIVFFRKGGGGEDDDISEAHDSTFRI